MSCKLKLVGLLFFFQIFFLKSLLAQELLPDFIETNGTIRAASRIGDTLIFGGNFSRVYETENTYDYSVLIDKFTKKQIKKGWDEPNGAVYAVVKDNKGGYYFGGSFTKVGNYSFNNIARIDSNGKVDTTFKLKIDNVVKDLIFKNDTLYIAGNYVFATNGGDVSEKPYVTEYSNKKLSSILNVDGIIKSIISDNNGGWFITGYFNTVNKVARAKFAHIDSLGMVLSETISLNSNAEINSILLHGDTLFLGGTFTSVLGQSRSRLASIKVSNWQLTSWNPISNNTVSNIYISDKHNSIFIFGTFGSINSSVRYGLAKFKLTDGLLESWAPIIAGNLNSLIVKNNLVYIAGKFSSVKGVLRNNIAAIDIIADTLTAFNPNVNNEISSIAFLNEDTLLIGGKFTSIGNISRSYFSGIVINTSLITSNWSFNSLNSNDIGYNLNSIPLLTEKEDFIYVGLNYTSSDFTQVYSNLYVLNKKDGLVSDNVGFNASVLSMVFSRNSVIVTGSFTTACRNPIPKFGILSYQTKWNTFTKLLVPNSTTKIESIAMSDSLLFVSDGSKLKVVNVNTSHVIDTKTIPAYAFIGKGSIWDMYVHNKVLFIAGDFIQIDTAESGSYLSRGRLASFDILSSGRLRLNSFDFYCGTLGFVNNIKVHNNVLYLCGSFSKVGGVNKQNLASINLSTNSLTSLSGTNNILYSIDIDDDYFYAGGENKLFQYDTKTYNIINNDIIAKNNIYCILLNNNTVFLGGNYNVLNFNSLLRSNIFAYDTRNRKILDWNPTFAPLSAIVHDIEARGKDIYIAGSFSSISNKNRVALAVLSLDSIQPKNTNFTFSNGRVNDLLIVDSLLLMGGLFKYNDGVNQPVNFVSYNLNKGKLIQVYPDPNQEVYSMAKKDSILFLGGAFSKVYAQNRSYLAAFNISTLMLKPLAPVIDSMVFSLHVSDSNLFVGGRFKLINGFSREKFAIFNLNNFSLTSYRRSFNQYIHTIVAKDSIVYVGGYFTNVNSSQRSKFACFNYFTDTLLNYHFNFNNVVYKLLLDTGSIYFMGNFNSVNNKTHTSLGLSVLPTNFKIKETTSKKICKNDSLSVDLKFIGINYWREPIVMQNIDSYGNIKNSFNLLNTGTLNVPSSSLYLDGNNYRFKFLFPKANIYTNTYTVNVMKSDTIWINNLSKSDTICTGDSVLLMANRNNNLVWFKNGNIFTSGIDSVYVSESGVYYVVSVDSNNCYSVSNNISISKTELPRVPFISTNTTGNEFCEGDSLVLYSSESSNIQWYKDGVLIGSSVDSLVVTSGGVFSVTHLGLNNKCNSVSQPLEVYKRTLPNKPIIFRANDTLYADVATSSYRWYLNDTLLLSENSKYIKIVKTGTYRVEVINDFNCSSFSDSYFAIVTGLVNIQSDKVRIFPNPSSNFIEVYSDKKITSYKIHNILGLEVLSGNNLKNKIDVSSFSRGIYVIYIELENKEIIAKRLLFE